MQIKSTMRVLSTHLVCMFENVHNKSFQKATWRYHFLLTDWQHSKAWNHTFQWSTEWNLELSWVLDDIFMFFNNILQKTYIIVQKLFLECDYGVVVMKEVYLCVLKKYSPVFMGKIWGLKIYFQYFKLNGSDVCFYWDQFWFEDSGNDWRYSVSLLGNGML